MRLIKQNIGRDGSGTATLFPEEPEDMWHAYNLIAAGDQLRASAIRRVTAESATGSTSSHRVHVTLLIVVKSIDFDPQAGQLHVSGQVAEENKWARVGAFHTLDLELHRNFTIEKKDGWDSVALDALKEAIKQDKEGAVPAIVMQEGIANICLITEFQTILKQRVETTIPKKRTGRSSEHDKALTRFYATCLDVLKRHFDLAQPRPVLIASPGFIATGFVKYIFDEASRAGDRLVLGNKKNFITIHSSSGHLHSLNEVLKSPEALTKLKDTKYAKETQLVDDFMDLLRKDDGRAWYGAVEVEKAVAQGAVGRGGGTLLINHSLFRSQEIGVRKRWVSLVDKVKENGGEVRILSSDHESGKRLEGLGNIAAILTYPLHDLDETSNEDEE
ncbi:Protein dom34 [Golovinomyces cichoracearum]|uniref:Protein DOM34 homolog n=1 Tax=Golovinomyces cichoracearum TaxID=62708 RepID=A0A420HKJ3_9PEZI|nr:Protein dom34 [Golovinomyces cichoracearum]